MVQLKVYTFTAILSQALISVTFAQTSDWVTSCESSCGTFFSEFDLTSPTTAMICAGLLTDGEPCVSCIQSVNSTAFNLVDETCPSQVTELTGSSSEGSNSSSSTAAVAPAVVASGTQTPVTAASPTSTSIDWVDDCLDQCGNLFQVFVDDGTDLQACNGLTMDGASCTNCIRSVNATGYNELGQLCPSVVARLASSTSSSVVQISTSTSTSSSSVSASSTPTVSTSSSSPSTTDSAGNIDWVTDCATACGNFFPTIQGAADKSVSVLCAALTSDGPACPICIQSTNATGFEEVQDVCPAQVAALLSTSTMSAGPTVTAAAVPVQTSGSAAAGLRIPRTTMKSWLLCFSTSSMIMFGVIA